jgi:DNA photolyase
MDTAIVVFTRDLRLHDNPALYLACARAQQVVPLFVVDPALGARSANRARFRPNPSPTCAPPCASEALTWSCAGATRPPRWSGSLPR